MEFRDLKKQYQRLKPEIDQAIQEVLENANFISGRQVEEFEIKLAKYVGIGNCISCANGTDALSLALKTLNIHRGDAIFIPNFTFFSTGEVVCEEGAVPVFVDIDEATFNISPESLEEAIIKISEEGKYAPKAVIAVDLFGQPADYNKLLPIIKKYHLYLIEDGAQGFGGRIGEKKACSFGDIATTSFFPAKPLGCYGDGGAIFTNNEEIAELLKSLRIHGKGKDKYDNIRIGRNSRLDTMQAAILKVKLDTFQHYEWNAVNQIAETYSKILEKYVKIPVVLEGFFSSWAQYSILLEDKEQRDGLKDYLKEHEIPSFIYYNKTMQSQKAFQDYNKKVVDLSKSERICERILSIPMHPYLANEEIEYICDKIINYVR